VSANQKKKTEKKAYGEQFEGRVGSKSVAHGCIPLFHEFDFRYGVTLEEV
jgi:hypothetical protein